MKGHIFEDNFFTFNMLECKSSVEDRRRGYSRDPALLLHSDATDVVLNAVCMKMDPADTGKSLCGGAVE